MEGILATDMVLAFGHHRGLTDAPCRSSHGKCGCNVIGSLGMLAGSSSPETTLLRSVSEITDRGPSVTLSQRSSVVSPLLTALPGQWWLQEAGTAPTVGCVCGGSDGGDCLGCNVLLVSGWP